MRAGKLRHRVTLEWYQKGPRSDSGATPPDWVAGATVWASVEPLSGRLLLAAQEAQSETSGKIRMRWRADVAAATGKTLRLQHNGLTYRIEGRPLDLDGRRRELEIMVHEWV
ncbi:phage head closure protein [Halomonas organivorans]|uniref:SPP1 family predicted phage head-tail adaptor n=1 Tax=Halomonas organivorans TaxID=257772 RepID=A0A7W5BZT1_9GAMM|nr:phage head closure protein [Halomonas organivorans]MBB3142196.1 SPP1 family predicted phage head-tail adaptor [Halomonas organivorans]